MYEPFFQIEKKYQNLKSLEHWVNLYEKLKGADSVKTIAPPNTSALLGSVLWTGYADLDTNSLSS